MKTILDIIKLSSAYLQAQGIPRSRREAEALIAEMLNLRRLDLYLQFEKPLTDEELNCLRKALKRRGQREPLAYISEKIQFDSIELSITPDVLIPRQETEILVEKIILSLAQCDLKDKIALDCCTGSGYIAIALKKRFPELTVIGIDICPHAIQIAKQNAASNNVKVEWLLGNLFAPFKNRMCDFFICNPPYISEKEYLTLDPEVKNFEPKLALVGGITGLEYYEKIATHLSKHLAVKGKGWLEIGTNQGEAIKRIFESNGWSCFFEQDWSGHDRFFFLEN